MEKIILLFLVVSSNAIGLSENAASEKIPYKTQLFISESKTKAIDKKLNTEVEKIPVKIKLEEMYTADRTARLEFNRLLQKGFGVLALAPYQEYLDKIDHENQTELKKIIAKNGWPSISSYGILADNRAYIIVVHAGYDIKFQKKILNIFREKVKIKDTDPKNYAYLQDKINVASGKPQIYGTQGRCRGKSIWVPEMVEDPTNLDARRKLVGLGPMEDYKKEVGEFMCNYDQGKKR